jgi:hypothetical protein
MLSALLMLHRVVRAVGHAIREEDFLHVASAGVLLVLVGTLSYPWARTGTSSTPSTSPSPR